MAARICPICSHYIQPDESMMTVRHKARQKQHYHETCYERTRKENGFRKFNTQKEESNYEAIKRSENGT